MSEKALPNFGKQFLGEVDRYLKENWQTLRGAELARIYTDMLHASQELRGSAGGWTGLPPFLFVRLLYYQLGGAFSRKSAPGEPVGLVSATGEVRFGEGLPVTVGFQTRKPDIALFHRDQLAGVIQIKAHLARGVEDLMEEVKPLETLRFAHPEVRAVLVSFNRLPEQGQLWFDFARSKNNRGWLDLLTLDGNQDRVSERLRQGLGLDRLKAETSAGP